MTRHLRLMKWGRPQRIGALRPGLKQPPFSSQEAKLHVTPRTSADVHVQEHVRTHLCVSVKLDFVLSVHLLAVVMGGTHPVCLHAVEDLCLLPCVH